MLKWLRHLQMLEMGGAFPKQGIRGLLELPPGLFVVFSKTILFSISHNIKEPGPCSDSASQSAQRQGETDGSTLA
jgi:hypothetical protein